MIDRVKIRFDRLCTKSWTIVMILMHGRFKFQQLDLKMHGTLWSCGDEARYHSITLERKYLYSVVSHLQNVWRDMLSISCNCSIVVRNGSLLQHNSLMCCIFQGWLSDPQITSESQPHTRYRITPGLSHYFWRPSFVRGPTPPAAFFG